MADPVTIAEQTQRQQWTDAEWLQYFADLGAQALAEAEEHVQRLETVHRTTLAGADLRITTLTQALHDWRAAHTRCRGDRRCTLCARTDTALRGEEAR